MTLQFLTIPQRLKNQHVVVQVDNMACVLGMESRCMKGDVCAAFFVKALHLISSYLGRVINVMLVPRSSR